MNFYNSNLDCTKTKWDKYIHFNQWRIQGERQGVGAPPPGNRESATVIVTFKKGNSSYLIFTDEKNLQTTVINKWKAGFDPEYLSDRIVTQGERAEARIMKCKIWSPLVAIFCLTYFHRDGGHIPLAFSDALRIYSFIWVFLKLIDLVWFNSI